MLPSSTLPPYSNAILPYGPEYCYLCLSLLLLFDKITTCFLLSHSCIKIKICLCLQGISWFKSFTVRAAVAGVEEDGHRAQTTTANCFLFAPHFVVKSPLPDLFAHFHSTFYSPTSTLPCGMCFLTEPKDHNTTILPYLSFAAYKIIVSGHS